MSRTSQIQKLFFDTLMESQYWPREKLQDLQRTHLARLLRHARAQVPFYKERLESIFTPSGGVNWERWSDLPIVTREDLLVHRDAMRARELAPGHSPVSFSVSSGSSGTPIRVASTQYAMLAHSAAIFRAHRWHGLDWSRDMLSISGSDPLTGIVPDCEEGPIWGASWLAESSGHSLRLNPFNSLAEILDFIEERSISYLTCRPKTAQALALEALRTGRTVPLDSIVCAGTATQPDEEDDCRRAFGAVRLFGPYSSSEASMIAYRCPSGDHFHVNEEQTLVEIVDESGTLVGPGEMGRVVVTPIFNFAQPLIRYDQGDLAVLGQRCESGRTLGTLDRIVGRATHLFRFPDGKILAPKMPAQFRGKLGARFWQIAQIGPLAIEVRYVPFEDANADEAAAAQIVRQFTHPAAIVTFSREADLVRVEGGKFIEYVYEVKNRGAP